MRVYRRNLLGRLAAWPLAWPFWVTTLVLGLLLGPRTAVAAVAPMISCRTAEGRGTAPQIAGPVAGPCAAADSVALLPPAAGYGPVWLTNFGLLVEEPGMNADAGAAVDAGPGRPKYGLVCEESFGGKVPERFVRHPDGRLLLATFDGVYSGTPDACGFSRATGSTAFRGVPALVIDPQEPKRVFALTLTPPALHESQDGGLSFAVKAELPQELRPERLYAVATPPTTTLYLGAYTAAEPLVLGVSDDGGATLRWQRFGKEAFARADVTVQLDGPAPGAPGTLFAATGVPSGPDEVWRSQDGGQTFVRVLALTGTEVRAGLAFGQGAAAGTVYVAGRELFPVKDVPGAHLYLSRDGGSTFAAPVAAPPGGPTYRCLGAGLGADFGRLYACGGGPSDDFLFGQSDDEGRTWTPLTTITDIAGPRACTSGRCLATAIWLCDSYGVCSDDLPRPQGDGGSADEGGVDQDASQGPRPSSDDGCGCRVGTARPSGPRGAGGALLLSGVWVAARAFARYRRRSS